MSVYINDSEYTWNESYYPARSNSIKNPYVNGYCAECQRFGRGYCIGRSSDIERSMGLTTRSISECTRFLPKSRPRY